MSDLGFLLVATDHREAASALTVQAEVLSEGLEQENIVSVFLEKADRVSVFVEVSRREALVGAVEAAEELLGLDDIQDVKPLSLGWVNTGRVVGTDVEENKRVVLGGFEVSQKSIVVESLGLGVVVPVLLRLHAEKLAKSLVDRPGGGGDKVVDVLVGVPLGEKHQAESEGTSSRDGLSTCNSVLKALLAVLAVAEFDTLFNVGVDALDASVFVVGITLEHPLLSNADAFKDKWLALVATVSTHTEEDFLWVLLGFESLIETKDGIRGGGGEVRPGRHCGKALSHNVPVGSSNVS